MKNRSLLMIPGPIEFEPEVMAAMAVPTDSHVSADFIDIFGQSLEMMRCVWQAQSGQPFILAGSGTLAMDAAGANLIEPGDRALVLSTGYFGPRYAELLRRYGADVTIIEAPLGEAIDPEKVEAALKKEKYKLLTFTHVDTSTAVRVDPRPIGKLGEKYGVLTILDGVCSLAGEELDQDNWGIDIALTASQKAIGVPPGLALLVAGPRAMKAWAERKEKVGNYYVDWNHWLPIMDAYENRKPAYFATPAVNLICALQVSLKQILAEGLPQRFERHKRMGEAIRSAVTALGLGMVPVSADVAASTLSAPRYPQGISGGQLLPKIVDAGIIVAGGLHPDIKQEYFRIGHMGATRTADILATVGALESALMATGHSFEIGTGLAAAQKILI